MLYNKAFTCHVAQLCEDLLHIVDEAIARPNHSIAIQQERVDCVEKLQMLIILDHLLFFFYIF